MIISEPDRKEPVKDMLFRAESELCRCIFEKQKRNKRVYVSTDSFSSSSVILRSTNHDSKFRTVSIADTRNSFLHYYPLLIKFLVYFFLNKPK